jgi:hypothetical protein
MSEALILECSGALGQVGVPEPKRVEWLSHEGHHAR